MDFPGRIRQNAGGAFPSCYAKKGPAVDDKLIEQVETEALAYGIVAGAALLALAGLFFGTSALRRRWLPLRRLRPVEWTGAEVILAFCIFGFRNVIAGVLLQIGFF